MRRLLVTCLAVLAPASSFALTAHTITVQPAIAAAVIVGRTVCSDGTWLLTDGPDLVRVLPELGFVRRVRLRGLTEAERPWGLACLSDGTLWTLADSNTLAQLDRAGSVSARRRLALPRLSLFSAGERLLFVQLPFVSATSLLSTSPPGRDNDIRAWAGLRTRPAASDSDQVTANLANCGPGISAIPCWFADGDRIAVSTAEATSEVRLPWLHMLGADVDAPIRDVAAIASGGLWILVSVRDARSKKTGRWVVHAAADGGLKGVASLVPGARVIVSATERACVLITTAGNLVRVEDE